MSSKLFQGLIYQMKEAVNRTVGVLDDKGVIIACSTLSKIGEAHKDALDEVSYSFDTVVIDGFTYKPVGSHARIEYVVFAEGNDDKARSAAAMLSVTLASIKTLYDEKYDKANFIKNIILDNILPSDIYIKSKELHFDAETPRVVYLARFAGNNEGSTIPFDIVQNLFPDKAYLKFTFKAKTGKKLDLKNPKTLNEKLQWLKLYDRNPKYTGLVDKYEVKKYISSKLGEEYVIPTLGVWDSFDEIDFDTLPDQFVLKSTHDSGGLVICKDKSTLDIEVTREKIERSLKRNYYVNGREWPYKNVRHRIIAEKYMTDSSESNEFTDYKFYCFNGYVDSVMVCYDRSIGAPKFYFFDKKWELKRYNKRGLEAPEGFTLPKPDNIDKMFEIAETLSKDVGSPFLRVDLYNSNGQIYFGEVTFFPDSGFDPNRLPETDRYFGDLVFLNKK